MDDFWAYTAQVKKIKINTVCLCNTCKHIIDLCAQTLHLLIKLSRWSDRSLQWCTNVPRRSSRLNCYVNWVPWLEWMSLSKPNLWKAYWKKDLVIWNRRNLEEWSDIMLYRADLPLPVVINHKNPSRFWCSSFKIYAANSTRVLQSAHRTLHNQLL